MNDTRSKLIRRSEFIQSIRHFFSEREVVEVDTRLLREFSVTDPYMCAFEVKDPRGLHSGYLQTSPEYAMKELLSEGSGDIYQLGKMFRANENGPIHSAEFTMLEWYRVGMNHFELIEEVSQLIQALVGPRKVVQLTYQQAFKAAIDIDPFLVDYDELVQKTEALLGEVPKDLLFDNYLTLLFAEVIEKQFDPSSITVVHSYPLNQASLAKLSIANEQVVADRFEVYLEGLELANGFNELTNADEQLQRFNDDTKIREKLNYPLVAVDAGLINALKKGIPNCSGVALGVDRLLMINEQVDSINKVLVQ